MKKLLSVLLIALLVLAGCGSKDDGNKDGDNKDGDTSTLKVGTGIVASSKVADPKDGEDGKFEANVTYATVVLEGDKVKYVTIDTAQNAIVVTSEGPQPFTARDTKYELGEEYGMKKTGSDKEWFEQIDVLTEWMVGKTLDEIKGASSDADVTSSVSISVDGYISAVEDAIKTSQEVVGLVKVGQSSVTNGSVEEDGSLEISTTVTATGLDADGKVVYAFVDEAQLKGTFADNKVTATEFKATKGKLGEEYGMKATGSKLEWNEQVKVVVDYVMGKTVAEIKGASEASDVTSSVSIYTGNFVSGLEKAANNAKAI